jgi:hypothetical protein
MFILIFIVVLVSFYLIISNFGIKPNENLIYTNGESINKDSSKILLEQKLSILKNELVEIKNKINSNNNTNQFEKTNFSTSQISIPVNNGNTNNANSNSESGIKEIIIEQDNQSINTSNLPSSINNQNPNINSTVNKPPPIVYDPIANYDMAKLTDPLVDPRGRTSADQIPTPQVAMQFNFPTQGVLDRYHRVGLLIAIGNDVKKEKIDHIEMPYSISDKSNYSSTDSYSGSDSGSEFLWNGPSKTNINKRKKKFITMETDSEKKTYKGIDIKENFDNYTDSDSYEYFGNTDKSITNVYNVYSNNNDNNILELIGKKITDNWYKYFTSITMGNKIIKVVVCNKNRKELYSGDIVYIPELKRTYRVKIDPMDMIEYNPYLF